MDQVVSDRAANKAGRQLQKKQESKGVQKQKIDAASRTKILNLDGGKIKQFPTEIARIDKLKTLNLKNNLLTSLPSNFAASSLDSLKKLNLSNNEIQSLPNSFGRLTVLEDLDLDKNLISEINVVFPRSLKKLSMKSNRLVSFPDLQESKNIKEIYLSQNNISGNLPGWIGDFAQLRILDVDDNSIENIEDNAGRCDTLQTLYIRRNKLTISGLPSRLLTSKSLATLQLEGNKITKAELMKAEGYEDFNTKRTDLLNKAMAGGIGDLDTSVCGLD